MNVVLWIVAALLAVAFLGAGSMKLLRSREQLKSSGMGWVDDFSPAAVKAIGALEVLGAIGLVLPALLDIAPILVPLAATGLALAMIGAVVVHARRHEMNTAAPSVVLLVLSVFVAWGRFGPYSF
ncbi:DoxX family protein [Actinoplanes sp. N902-109]|uniref:DoxX family protein n=1 Tax=Actinoplanes sp. (strain N902-109) TaxID=649831 RepID=UPI000329372F|nr:DoxX family protein [Actinoplanes sp. N902-109]AGL18323.1 DoxX family protein [Actinoplanes sp. N902-109]